MPARRFRRAASLLWCAFACCDVVVARASPDEPAPQHDSAIWLAPLHAAELALHAIDESSRAYSVVERPRDVAGEISLWCERRAGAKCGDGVGTVIVAETRAGLGEAVVGALRVRSVLGTESYEAGLELDRLFVTARYAGLALELGRDAFEIGPGVHTNMAWSTHAPPLDHVRVSRDRPLAVGDHLALRARYLVGRLRAPQTIPNNLVSIATADVDIARDLHLGVVQLLQLGGNGTGTGAWDFIAEHVRRGDASASASDSSNRRFGGHIALDIPALYGGRVYYSVVFEDIRRARLIDAVRYDADHLAGADFARLGPIGLTLEWHVTGLRSHEHVPRATGLTNRGFVVGAPLGADAQSLFVSGRVALGRVDVAAWVELARLSSDRYDIVVDGPINPGEPREDEARYRFGVLAGLPLRDDVSLHAEAAFEHVDDFQFVSGVTRDSVGVAAKIVWHPTGPLGRLVLN